MSEKIHKCGITKEKGYLYFVDGSGNVAKVKRGESNKTIVCKNDGEFSREDGWIYFVDKQGDVSRSKMKSFKEYAELKDEAADQLFVEKNWIAGAINPDHKGFCTPMSKPTCTPHRKALAKRFKGGDLHHGA
jgi:hypothetical protein